MKTLFAITYPTMDEAKAALARLAELQKGQTITLADAVIVTRSEDGAVKLDQTMNTTAVGALSGALWGSLIGLIFLSPLIGAAVGAAAGAASGYATDYGISDEFMTAMGQKMSGVGATLFIMATNITVERVAEAIGSPTAQVVYTNMPDDLETRFKSKFSAGADEARTPPAVDIAPM
jgi:uncharacterized membrane protein